MIKLSAAALGYARQPGFHALIFSDVKPPTGPAAAYKQSAAADMHEMGLTVATENIFFGKTTGRRSERTTMAVVAQSNDGADHWLRGVLSGRPLDGSVMQTAASFGAIELRDGSVKAKVQLLPFDGSEYGVFAFVDPALLLNETHGSERLGLIQRLMVTPMVRAATDQLVRVTEASIGMHESESADESLEPVQRSAATKKAAHQTDLLDALNRILQSPEEYIIVASQPLQSFPCLDALDAMVPLIPRNDGDTDASRRRSSLGWAFARDSAIATVAVRKQCHVPLDERAAMMVAQRLLRMATPAGASVLRPTGSVAEVKLVKPSKVSESRITAAAVKAKLHILACDQPWGYDAVADANSSNTDQATYTIPHAFILDADAETWAEAFRVASRTAGTPVDLVIETDHFSVTTLPVYTGPDVHVYNIEDVIVDVNAECNAAVGTDGIAMEFTRAEVADATPTNLRRAVEAGGHLAAIVRWSRSQPPGTDPLPWHAETIPAATLAPVWPASAGGTNPIPLASVAPPAARFEGLTQTIARVNNIEGVLAAVARSQAQSMEAIVQLTASVAALVQHAGIPNALPPAPPPTPPPRSYAAITAATAPAVALATLETNVEMEPAAADAPAANTGFQPSSTTASAVSSATAHGRAGASPSAEMDLNDDSPPVPDAAPVSRRTRLASVLESLLPVRRTSSSTLQGTVEGPPTWAAMTRRVRFADEREWDDEYDASTDDEYGGSDYVHFDEDGDDVGAPVVPENSDGLESFDVPTRAAAAGEGEAVALRRVIVYAGPGSALTADGSMRRLGMVTTPAGRRSARLSSSAATGGGTAAESDETRAAILHSLEAERTVVAQLRAARPPTPDETWSESGGDELPGAAHEVDVAEPDQLDATTATADDVDDTQQHEGETHEAYEDRLNGMIPPPQYFCCRPVFF